MSWKRTVLITVVILAALLSIFIVWGDEELDPGAERLLADVGRLPARENLFNALVGFAIAPEEDPLAAGYVAVTRVNAYLRDPSLDWNRDAEKIKAAWIKPELDLALDDELLCSPAEAGCIARLWRAGDSLRELADRHAVLLARLSNLQIITEYQTETVPSVVAPILDWKIVTQIHRLRLATLLVDSREDEAGAAAALSRDIGFIRRYLAEADTILSKMIAARLLAEALYVYAVMDNAIAPLQRLSSAELDLTEALEYEFVLGARLYLHMDGNPSLLSRDFGLPGWLGSAAVRPLFKAGRTINLSYRCFLEELEMHRLPAAGLLERSAGEWTCAASIWDYLVNPVGAILFEVARPSYATYGLRLHNLAGLLSLIDAKRAIRDKGVAEGQIQAFLASRVEQFADPYTGEALQFDAEQGTLVFDVPGSIDHFSTLALDPFSAVPAE